MQIRADLLARLYALHRYFYSLWRQVPLYQHPMHMPMITQNDGDVIPFPADNTDSSTGEAGGGGTMTGLRVERPQESRMKI